MTADEAFALIEAAALKGERCPQGAPYGPLQRNAVTALRRDGRIRFELYALNWRVATILTGQHAGKRTAPCPIGRRTPKLILGQKVECGRRPASSSGPSKPKDYSRGV